MLSKRLPMIHEALVSGDAGAWGEHSDSVDCQDWCSSRRAVRGELLVGTTLSSRVAAFGLAFEQRSPVGQKDRAEMRNTEKSLLNVGSELGSYALVSLDMPGKAHHIVREQSGKVVLEDSP